MTVQTLPELLANQSAAKLQAMEEAIDEQIADLKLQKKWIGNALISKGVRPKPAAKADSKPSAAPKRSRKAASRNGSTDTIRAIFRENPESVLMPAQVIAIARERGASSTDQAIRVALRRMRDQGFLERGPDGWKLASSNGSAQESFSEAETSEPGGMGG
jgi:hypothetical protein